MPWTGRLLLLGIAIPMVLFSHVSYGRDMQKSPCVAALTEVNNQIDSARESAASTRFNKSASLVSYDKTRWLSQILREEFHVAPAPQKRGMDNITDANLRRWTDDSKLMVMIIDPNVDAHKYVRPVKDEDGREPSSHRYLAKPSYLKKCKSISDGPEHARGLVACHKSFFANEQDWQNTKDDLSKKNLYVDEENHYLVYAIVNGEKKYFFSDMDLFAVFRMTEKGAKPYFRHRQLNQMNRVANLPPGQGFQHGPRQDYHGKADLGFKFPVTAYVPGIQEPIHIRTVCELKKFYQILNLSLEEIWGDYFSRNQKELQFCEGK